MENNLLFSVVVCTYNRAHYVREFLPTALAQAFDPTQYEVIVVDNNSSDDTRQVVAQLQTQYPHLRSCFEPQQGLSHARNCGWQAARGAYVAYLDDECKVPLDWLQRAQTITEQHAPLTFGGDIDLFFDAPPPSWWRESYNPTHRHSQGTEPHYLAVGQTLFGGNLFVRRDVLQQVGGFDPAYGMRGKVIFYGEESELLERIAAAYPDQPPYYDPALRVYHLVRPDKLTLRWAIRESIGRADTFQRLYKSTAPYLSRWDALRFTLYAPKEILLQAIYAFAQRDKQRYPQWQNALYENENLHDIWTTWGHIHAHHQLRSWK